jgi:anti-sigma regulatory factor (Ser/Thr protein kinase)
MKASRSFPPDAASIRAARRFVLDSAGSVGKQQRDVIAVMVSELAMNAVQHARTAFAVTVQRTETGLWVEVTDSAPGSPQAQPLPPASSTHGRGLFIVDQFADTWGITPAPSGTSGKSVWFRTSLEAMAR